jgi:hypothetical protein
MVNVIGRNGPYNMNTSDRHHENTMLFYDLRHQLSCKQICILNVGYVPHINVRNTLHYDCHNRLQQFY